MMLGLQLIDAEAVGDAYEDWSGVRSHGRAARRRKRGFPQRIVIRYKPNGRCIHDKIRNVIYIHPFDRYRLEAEIRRRDEGSPLHVRARLQEQEPQIAPTSAQR